MNRRLMMRCIEMAVVEYIAYETIATVGNVVKEIVKSKTKKKEKGDTIIFKQNGKEYEVVL